jgi:hypothetical protein
VYVFRVVFMSLCVCVCVHSQLRARMEPSRRCKLLQFFEVKGRPPWFGVHPGVSTIVNPRNPFQQDSFNVQYDYHSEDDYNPAEPEDGEELGSEEEEEDAAPGDGKRRDGLEDDDGFLVPEDEENEEGGYFDNSVGGKPMVVGIMYDCSQLTRHRDTQIRAAALILNRSSPKFFVSGRVDANHQNLHYPQMLDLTTPVAHPQVASASATPAAVATASSSSSSSTSSSSSSSSSSSGSAATSSSSTADASAPVSAPKSEKREEKGDGAPTVPAEEEEEVFFSPGVRTNKRKQPEPASTTTTSASATSAAPAAAPAEQEDTFFTPMVRSTKKHKKNETQCDAEKVTPDQQQGSLSLAGGQTVPPTTLFSA